MYFFWKFIFWLGLWFSILAADFILPDIVFNKTFKTVSFYLGVLFVAYGLILNAVAGKTLKKFAHFDIKKGIQKPERMLDFGIFSCMRHPAMFGSIFFSVGLALLGGKLATILWSGWVSFIALYFISAVEERETLEQFGSEYCEFLKNRKPFSFSLSCLLNGIRFLKNEPSQSNKTNKN